MSITGATRVTAIAIGLLAVSAMGGAAVDPSPAPQQAVLVTGVVTGGERGTQPYDVVVEGEGLTTERGQHAVQQSEMSDPRLSGEVTFSLDADRYCPEPCTVARFADVIWGTVEIVNDGGTWVGTHVSTSNVSDRNHGIGHYELVGTGAYEGLSAILFETERMSPDGTAWNGVILPGALPPDR